MSQPPAPASPPAAVIEEFSMDDYAVVHVLWQRSDLWMRPSDGPEATLLKLARDPGLFLVARAADGRVVGTVMGGWDGRRAYVYHLAVAPERRREGIGDALMDELESRFRALGALKAKLQILVENETSRAFFAQRGYLLESDCEPWGKELVEGGAPPCR
jgi:ribosomal protein S18 acetylase RimI-like enzyme